MEFYFSHHPRHPRHPRHPQKDHGSQPFPVCGLPISTPFATCMKAKLTAKGSLQQTSLTRYGRAAFGSTPVSKNGHQNCHRVVGICLVFVRVHSFCLGLSLPRQNTYQTQFPFLLLLCLLIHSPPRTTIKQQTLLSIVYYDVEKSTGMLPTDHLTFSFWFALYFTRHWWVASRTPIALACGIIHGDIRNDLILVCKKNGLQAPSPMTSFCWQVNREIILAHSRYFLTRTSLYSAFSQRNNIVNLHLTPATIASSKSEYFFVKSPTARQKTDDKNALQPGHKTRDMPVNDIYNRESTICMEPGNGSTKLNWAKKTSMTPKPCWWWDGHTERCWLVTLETKTIPTWRKANNSVCRCSPLIVCLFSFDTPHWISKAGRRFLLVKKLFLFVLVLTCTRESRH